MFLASEPDAVWGTILTSLKAVVSEILQFRDFQISDQDGYLMARRKDAEAAFCLLSSPDKAAVDAFSATFREFEGRKIVATLGILPTAFIDSIDSSIVVWDREALEHEIGRTRIEKIVGERDHGLVDELIADDYPKTVTPEQLEKIQDAGLGERIVRPIIEISDVKEISRQTVSGFRHRLELVPHYVYSYTCDLYMDGNKLASEKGTLSVNALTRRVENWNETLEIVYALELNHRRLEPALDAGDAKKLSKQAIVRMHSYEKEIIREEGHVTVMEKKKVAPKEEEVKLEDKGIFYIPVWCVEGVHGVMIINASTGKVVSEDYYQL